MSFFSQAMQPPLLPNERLWRVVFLALGALAIVFQAALFFGVMLPTPACGFQKWSGLPCAMCGGTRAASALAAGDWKGALEWNALAVPVLAAIVFGALVCLIELLRGRALIEWSRVQKWPVRFLVPGLGLLVLWWIFHMRTALENPDRGLANREKPVAAAVAGWLGIR